MTSPTDPPDEDPFRKAQRELEEMEKEEGRLLESFDGDGLRKSFSRQRDRAEEDLDKLEAKLLEAESRLQAESERRVDDAHAKELAERLEHLDSKLAAIKEKRENRSRTERKRAEQDRESAIGLGVGMYAAYAIIGGPLFGACIGWAIDRVFGITTLVPICVLVFGAIGVCAAFIMLRRSDR